MTAEISPCGIYRYTLTRKTNCPLRWIRKALFVMLNPSTADSVENDPTIRRCVSFAEHFGCTDLTVVNLFALRATDPKQLVKHVDPVGPLNDIRIAEEIGKIRSSNNGIVVAAWGSNKFSEKRAQEVISKFGPFQCLGITKNGSPKHPLYLKKDSLLIDLRSIINP